MEELGDVLGNELDSIANIAIFVDCEYDMNSSRLDPEFFDTQLRKIRAKVDHALHTVELISNLSRFDRE
jgi:hypothetical protein